MGFRVCICYAWTRGKAQGPHGLHQLCVAEEWVVLLHTQALHRPEAACRMQSTALKRSVNPDLQRAQARQLKLHQGQYLPGGICTKPKLT